MADFQIHSIDTAPEDAKPLLENSKKSFGMIPNLHGVFAESPQALEAYKQLTGLFQQTSLSTEEQHVVWLTINVYNRCHYCVPAHSALAKMDKVDVQIVHALREERPLDDPKLEALRKFTLAVVEQRGHVDAGAVDAFLDAGFTKANILEVILGVSHKVLSNYTNHLAQTPIDAPFKDEAWTPKDARRSAAE